MHPERSTAQRLASADLLISDGRKAMLAVAFVCEVVLAGDVSGDEV